MSSARRPSGRGRGPAPPASSVADEAPRPRWQQALVGSRGVARLEPGHAVLQGFVQPEESAAIMRWLAGIHPLREWRRAGSAGRMLLRPVYWLGAWQFACLDYYRPPRATRDACLRAEAHPPPLARVVERIEQEIQNRLPREHVPRGWRLNTALINFYGSRFADGRWIDVARVGDHRDFEPGPVASISFGEKALLQFVEPGRRGERSAVVHEVWLEDRALQIIAGPLWKDRLLHRVQRVARSATADLPPAIEDFRTRRVNFTLRWVPERDIQRLDELSEQARAAVRGYVEELARHSTHFRGELTRLPVVSPGVSPLAAGEARAGRPVRRGPGPAG